MTFLLQFVSRLSLRTWLLTGCVALVLTGGAYARHWHLSTVDTARRATRDSIALAASLVAPEQRAAVTITKWRTDTQWLRAKATGVAATRQADRVDSAIAAVPVRVVDQEPAVHRLVVASMALSDSTRVLVTTVTALRADIVTERTAREALQITSDQIVISVRDSLAVEQAKPRRTWRSNAALTTGGAILGAAVTLFIKR